MLHLIRKYALLLLLLSVCNSCQKKYTCSHKYAYIGVQVSFGGYTPAELSRIVFQKFEPGNNFSTLISSDTIDGSNAAFKGDTAYQAIETYFYRGFFSLTADNDYKIKVLSGGGGEYTLSLREGEGSYTWTQTTYCSYGAGAPSVRPFIVNLNGIQQQLYPTSTNNYFLCLRR